MVRGILARIVSAVIVILMGAQVPASESDSVLVPTLVSDSAEVTQVDSMDVIADASNAYYHVKILQPKAGPTESDASNAVYIALCNIGERVDRQVYRLRTIAAPQVERVELGQLAFKMTMSYDLDISKKRVTATLKLDRLLSNGK